MPVILRWFSWFQESPRESLFKDRYFVTGIDAGIGSGRAKRFKYPALHSSRILMVLILNHYLFRLRYITSASKFLVTQIEISSISKDKVRFKILSSYFRQIYLIEKELNIYHLPFEFFDCMIDRMTKSTNKNVQAPKNITAFLKSIQNF